MTTEMDKPKALGTIVESPGGELSDWELYTPFLDFWDHWNEIDPRLESHHTALSPWAAALTHDLVDLASYADIVLHWLEPERIRDGRSVVVVGSVADAFIRTTRSACDVVASGLTYVASEKPGQAPFESLRALTDWARKNPSRVRPNLKEFLTRDRPWFNTMRSLRDYLVHDGCHANIHCSGRQFNLWVHSHRRGWVTREPLLPLLKRYASELLALSDEAGSLIADEISLPADRRRSRVVSGILIPRLHELLGRADDYADPSP